MRHIARRHAPFVPFCIAACLVLSATAGAEPDAKSAWDKPSEEVDSKVAAWAAQQFAAQAPAGAEQDVSTLAPVEPNPIRAQAARQPAPLPQLDPNIQPVRYGQEAGAEGATVNPLRGSEPTPSGDLAAARQAFSPTQSGSSATAANPFAKLDAQPAASAQSQQHTHEASPQPPPQDLQPLRDARAAFQGAPNQSPATTVSPAEVPPSIPPDPVQLAPSGQQAPGERSIIASRSSMARPFDRPTQEPMRSIDSQPDYERMATQQAFTGTPSTQSTGTGRPGGRELEGAQRASVVIEKHAPAEARIGQPCRFVLNVRNTGQDVAENVVLRDETPAGARLIETIPPAQHEGSQITWRLGSLAPGEERSVELHVEPIAEGAIGSVATVSFDAQASAVTQCTRPELALRLSAPGKVLVGERQPLTIEVHNPGTGVATGVMLIEDVPSNLRHEAGPELEFEVGSLAPGETRRLDLMLTAEAAGHVINELTAMADGGLRVQQSIEFEVVAPSLAVNVEGPERRYLERPASYTVSIGNPGTAPAKDVRLVTRLPRGMKFVRANNLGEYDAQTHSVYWSLAELPEGERGAVELVAMPVAPGEHTLVVEGEAHSGLKAAESQRITVEGVASLVFDVRDLQDPIEVGGQAAYDVVVTNEGTQAATNVRVVVEAPAGMRVAEARGQTQHTMGADRVEFAPIPTLEPGVKARFAVRMIGQQPGDQRVAVEVLSDDLTRPIRREESTRVFGDE